MKKFLTFFIALFLMGSMSVVQAATWTPAGTPASIFTNEWTPNTPANDMTLLNGLYTFVKSVNVSSNTNIQFKVCKDHAWTTAYPGSNYNFTIPNGSKYLIITYNTSGNAVNAFAISSMTVAGDNGTLFGSTWAPSATANDMTLQNDGTYKFEKSGVALSAGTVNFKACANHSWTNAWPSDNYELSIPESGNYTITITFNPATLAVSATADLEQAVVVIPTIKMHGNFTGSWADTEEFAVAGNEETASLTLTNVSKGNYEFGLKIDGTWTSNGSAFDRTNPSHAIAAGSGNCTFNADRNGDYTFTWTYATNTLEIGYPAIPAQSVTFNSLASQILKGSVINLANCVTSSGIDEPTYRFYIKEKEGEYGDAINANYNFNANGEYVVKVEAFEYGEPVASDESNVVVYQSYTFTNGSTIYVDFSAVSGDVKGVNYPKVDQVGMDWDGTGAGTVKAVTFTTNVTWTTMAESFIKTEKNGWANQPFTVPGTGKNCVVVAADGASYTWGTYTPIKLHGNFSGEWLNTDVFAVASNKETASLTLTNIAVGNYEFGVRIGSDDNWTSNGSAFTRANNSHAIAAGQGNCTLNADRQGDYTFTWTYATNTLAITYPAEPDAFVAGSSTEIFGTEWDATAEANKMTWNEGLSKYTKTYTVDKAYKSVALKVVYDGSWYGIEGGEDNVKFSLSGAGEFTVLFDKTTHYVTLEGTIVGDEQFDFEYVTVTGNGEADNSWLNEADWDETAIANRMTEVETNVYEISFSGVKGVESQFQFTFDGTWTYQFGGVFSSFGTATQAVYGNGGGNITFTPVDGADITIRLDLSNFNFATKQGATFTVSQVEPEPTYVTVRSGLEANRYYTICLEKNVTNASGATFWNLRYKNAEQATLVYLEEVQLPLEAGKPYIFQATANKLEVLYGTETSNGPIENGALRGTFNGIDAEAFAALPGNPYLLINNAIRPRTTGNFLAANRAYIEYSALEVNTPNSAPGRRVRAIPMQQNTATGIDELNGSEAPAKVLINGQLFILRGEKMYDAKGQLVK